MKQHRFQRIAAAALARAQPAGWTLLVLGVSAFLLLPLAGKKCYLDEKALLSGTFAACMAAYQQALPAAADGDLAASVAAAAAAVSAAMPSARPALAFHQHSYSTTAGGSSNTAAAQCSTLHTVVRSPRGDGSEGFVLLLPLDARRPAAAALAAAVGTATADHLRQSGWLAKDAALVFVDAACGGGALQGAQAWLSAYNSPRDLFSFPRAGLLQQALVLELAGAAPSAAPAVPAGAAAWAELSVHGAAGQLPNLDLYYLIKRNLDLHTAIPAVLRPSEAPLPACAQQAAEGVGAAASAAGLATAQAAQRHSAELAALAAFSSQLASGRPTGAHAPFLGLQVDAATLTLHLAALPEHPPSGASSSSSSIGSSSSGSPSTGVAAQPPSPQLQAAAASVLAAAEMVLRTLNNLQERLHHSTALYVLLSPDRFVSIAAYLAPPGCLLLATLAQAGAHAYPAPLGGRKLLQGIPFGQNLADCVAKVGLKSVAAVIAASSADVTELFTNAAMTLTFFAPDDATFNEIARNLNTTIPGIINRPGFPDYFLKNHLLNAPYYTTYWPDPGDYPGKYLVAMDGTSVNLWTDTQYTNRVMGLFNTKTRLACLESNLKCGNAVMHVIVDPELPVP
ncbi:hypothetical protein ABPG75_004309 [Micractinium tetrahymenae]